MVDYAGYAGYAEIANRLILCSIYGWSFSILSPRRQRGRFGIVWRGIGIAVSKTIVLKTLQPQQLKAIDRALFTIGKQGEVRIVIEKGKVRFIEKLRTKRQMIPELVNS